MSCNLLWVCLIYHIEAVMKVTKTKRIEALLPGCKKGDRAAQEQLFRLTASEMLGVCLRYTRNQAEAEDILQMGFVRVFTKLEQFSQKGAFHAWIRRIMVNTAIEAYRRRQMMSPMSAIDEQLEDSLPAPDEPHLEYADLVRLVQQLPGGYRIVFNMYVMEGFSHREISQALGITENTSKSQLSRARDWLKKRIKNQEGAVYESR